LISGKKINGGKFRLRVGDDYDEWRTNTFQQVWESQTPYVLLLQEDHQLVSNINDFQRFVLEVVSANVDVWQPSFFPEYHKNRKILEPIDIRSAESSMVADLDKRSWKKIEVIDKNYLISLVGLYKKDLCLTLLKSPHPFLRHYHPSTPFDFEQSQSQTWFLPIRYGLPKKEIMGCIDDDLSVPGSSLISRGLYSFDHERANPRKYLSENTNHNIKRIRFFLNRVDRSHYRYTIFRPIYDFLKLFFLLKNSIKKVPFTLMSLKASKKRNKNFKKIMNG